jgi:hypothetical protein
MLTSPLRKEKHMARSNDDPQKSSAKGKLVEAERHASSSAVSASLPNSLDARLKKIAPAVEPPSNQDFGALVPAFVEKLRAMLAALEAAGTPFKFVEGFRTVERQQWLYGSGRPLAKPYGRSGPIVTKRDGVKRLSNHQGDGTPGTGRAADCYPVKNGKVYVPPAADMVWRKYADAATAHGLVAGYNWKKFKDAPHIELPTDA